MRWSRADSPQQQETGDGPAIIALTDVHKRYRLGHVEVVGLAGVSLAIRRNRFTVVAGPSGSGKTTLLNLIGCIDRPSAGQVMACGADIAQLSDNALADLRATNIGFIFQSFNLVPVLTAAENVELALSISGMGGPERRERARAILDAVGLADRASNRPDALSGGQRQRVAIARALVKEPQVVLADEPTANLDSRTGAQIIALMRDMQTRLKTTFVFSSHDPQLIGEAEDMVTIRDGRIEDIRRAA